MTTGPQVEYRLDGRRTASLEAFFDEFSRVVLGGIPLGPSLDAFNDVLRGGFGAPEDGFTLRWVHSADARRQLGYPETARQLELHLARCHPDNRQQVELELSQARRGAGPTVFDWLVEIISDHGPGGNEAEDRVRLILE